MGLDFRRLSFNDLNTGHQPLSNADDTIWMTFNGELYNFQEQHTSLQKKGYQFKTNTDIEVIVNLYQEYGVNCVDFLRDMFAFAIQDDNIKQIFDARDRFGIKPFNYYIDNEKYVWGSQMKSIKVPDNIKTHINLEIPIKHTSFFVIINLKISRISNLKEYKSEYNGTNLFYNFHLNL